MTKTRPQSNLSFLLYVGLGALVMLLTDFAVPAKEALASRTFLYLSPVLSSGLLLVWSVSAIFWLRAESAEEMAEGAPKGSRLKFLIAGILFLWGVACFVKPVLSTDVNLYVAEGRQIVKYGQSPYLLPIDAMLPDPFLFQMSRGWLDNTCPYGPVALGLFAVVSLLPLQSLLGYIVGMKILMTTFLVGIGIVLWMSLSKDRLRFTKTVGVVANPVVIWYAVVDCHLDVMLIFFLLLGVEMARRQRPCLSALGVVGACGIKIFAILAAPLVFFWLVRKSHRLATWFAGAFGFLFAGMSLLSGNGDLAIVFQLNPVSMTRAAILPSFLTGIGFSVPLAITLSNLALVFLFVCLCLVILRGWFREELGIPVAMVFVAFVFTRNYWQPWYTLQYWPLLGLVARQARTHNIIVGSWLLCMPLYHGMGSFREVLISAVTFVVLRLAIDESGGVRGTAQR